MVMMFRWVPLLVALVVNNGGAGIGWTITNNGSYKNNNSITG